MLVFIYFALIALGARLWTYSRLYLPGRYTSILAFPVWGGAAVLFWLLLIK